MKSFRDLLVWQKGIALVTQVYAASAKFPRSETYGLTDQMRRAAVSIPAKIAEGDGWQSTQDCLRFLQIARGSLYELQTHFEIVTQLGFARNGAFDGVVSGALEIARMLSSLIAKVRSSS